MPRTPDVTVAAVTETAGRFLLDLHAAGAASTEAVSL
jgi:hypothetical protein